MGAAPTPTPNAMIPYRGPRPSPDLRMAPLLLAAAALVTGWRLWLCVLNLRDLSLLHQVHRPATPSTLNAFHQNLDHLKSLSALVTVATFATGALYIVWNHRRRPRARVKAYGEEYVATRLSELSRPLCVAWWALISFQLVVTQMAVLRGTPTYDEIVHRRSVLTITSIASAASGVTVFVIVWMARKHQRERESVPLPLPATP